MPRPSLAGLTWRVGALPPIRGRRDVLGARGDRQGPCRHPRRRRSGRGDREAGRHPARRAPNAIGCGPDSCRSSGSRERDGAEPRGGIRGMASVPARPRGDRTGRRGPRGPPLGGRSPAGIRGRSRDRISTQVPLLVVGTARPELLARRRRAAGRSLTSVRIDLGPLSDDETGAFVEDLLGMHRPGGDPRRDPRASRGESAVRRGVRSTPRRPWPAADASDGARAPAAQGQRCPSPTRSARCSRLASTRCRARRKARSRRRLGGRPGVLGGDGRIDGRARSRVSARRTLDAAGAAGVRAPRASPPR